MGSDKQPSRTPEQAIEVLREQFIGMARRRVPWHRATRLLAAGYALAAIDECGGNVSQAAREIHANRNTLERVTRGLRDNKRSRGSQ